MTLFMPDKTPDTWSKMEFSSGHLERVDGYISEHKVNAVITGAITIGALGASIAKVCFADHQQFLHFKEWFNHNVRYWQPSSRSYVSRNINM